MQWYPLLTIKILLSLLLSLFRKELTNLIGLSLS